MSRKSHRVIVEVTFDKRVTAKIAKNVVHEALIRGELDELAATYRVKEAERVIQAEIRNRDRLYQ